MESKNGSRRQNPDSKVTRRIVRSPFTRARKTRYPPIKKVKQFRSRAWINTFNWLVSLGEEDFYRVWVTSAARVRGLTSLSLRHALLAHWIFITRPHQRRDATPIDESVTRPRSLVVNGSTTTTATTRWRRRGI